MEPYTAYERLSFGCDGGKYFSHYLYTSNLTVTTQGRHSIGEYRTGIRARYLWSSSIPDYWINLRNEIGSNLLAFLTRFEKPANL